MLTRKGDAFEHQVLTAFGRTDLLVSSVDQYPASIREPEIAAVFAAASGSTAATAPAAPLRPQLVRRTGERNAAHEYLVITGDIWFYKATSPFGSKLRLPQLSGGSQAWGLGNGRPFRSHGGWLHHLRRPTALRARRSAGVAHTSLPTLRDRGASLLSGLRLPRHLLAFRRSATPPLCNVRNFGAGALGHFWERVASAEALHSVRSAPP